MPTLTHNSFRESPPMPSYAGRGREPRPGAPRSLTQKFRRVMALVLITAGAASGAFVDHAIGNARANAAQPACDVPVRDGGDNLTRIQDRFGTAGDRGDGVLAVTMPDGTERNSKNTSRFNIDGGLQPGDILRESHVDPNVCIKVGGVVVANVIKK